MGDSKRIRLVFKDDDILSENQKLDGLSRCWLLLNPHQHDTVSDVASHLLHAFQLHQSCPHGLLLSISGFVLPPYESTQILKDSEIIRVCKRRDVLSIEGNNAVNDVDKFKAVEKQPVNSGLLLLANEEFEKEKGGYESDEPDEGDEEERLKDLENPSGGNVDKKNRKRKAAEKLQSSKGKKQRSEVTGNASTSHQDEDLTGRKSVSWKEKKDDFIAKDNVGNDRGPVQISEKGDASEPSVKRTVEDQANNKETEDAKVAPKETKKVQSRNARRKSEKRRWLWEMGKIQKQNATCESEGLRNWKEDQAKGGSKKVDGQLKGLPKWRKHQADAERKEVDGQPKGLLQWKLSPQTNWLEKGKKRRERSQNDYFRKLPIQNGDVHEQQNQNGDGHEQLTQIGDGLEQPNQKRGDLHDQPGQKCGFVQERMQQDCDTLEQLNQESAEENEVVPVVIRPGHIRFLPSEKEQDIQQDQAPVETFQWNGITSKKKGQQWGKEKRPFTPRNDYKTPNKDYTENLSNDMEKQLEKGINFDKLPLLLGMPKEGDLIAYRVLELSSSWTPELSAYRVGKVSWYDAVSNQTMLVQVLEYPIVTGKADEDEVEAVQLDNSLYKEDGSLEIDFSSLIDARIINNGRSGNGTLCVSERSIGNVNSTETELPSSSDKQTVVPSSEIVVDIWDQVSEALNAKKEQLLFKANGWCRSPKKVQVSEEKSAKKVQPSRGSNWNKNTQKAHTSKDNSWDKQSSGGKSWSYKALRGSALGPTMAILRSRKDI